MLISMPEGQRGDATEDQHAQDLLGRVGRGADRVGAEDRQRLRLRQALAELLVARQRLADEDAADVRPDATGRGRRRAGRFLGRQVARAGVAEVRRVRPLDADAPVTGLATLERATAADHGRPSGADTQPIGETHRQARGAHRRADGLEVVGDPLPASRSRRRCRGPCSSPAGRRRAAVRPSPG